MPRIGRPVRMIERGGRKGAGRQLSHPRGSHLPSAVCAGHGKTGSEGQSQRGAGMLIHLRSQATTPMVRAAIRESTEPASALAERFGTTGQTVFKWKHLASVHDRSHRPHRVQTALTPAQEAVAVALRRTLLVSLDDLLAVVRAFLNPEVSRSGLDRCLRRLAGTARSESGSCGLQAAPVHRSSVAGSLVLPLAHRAC